MADPISALGALASVATVADLSCHAIGLCRRAIQHWKTRHEYWKGVKSKFAEYLRFLNRATEVVVAAKALNNGKYNDDGGDWESIVDRCREFCEALMAFHKIWEDQQAEKRETLGFATNAWSFYHHFILRPQAEKLLNEFDKAKVQILLYQQLITIELQLQGQVDVCFIKTSLRTIRQSSRPTARPAESVQSISDGAPSPQEKGNQLILARLTSGIEKVRKKKPWRTKGKKDKGIDPIQSEAITESTSEHDPQQLDEIFSISAQSLDEVVPADVTSDASSVLSTSTSQTSITNRIMEIPSLVLPIITQSSLSFESGDVILCQIDGKSLSGEVSGHIPAGLWQSSESEHHDFARFLYAAGRKDAAISVHADVTFPIARDAVDPPEPNEESPYNTVTTLNTPHETATMDPHTERETIERGIQELPRSPELAAEAAFCPLMFRDSSTPTANDSNGQVDLENGLSEITFYQGSLLGTKEQLCSSHHLVSESNNSANRPELREPPYEPQEKDEAPNTSQPRTRLRALSVALTQDSERPQDKLENDVASELSRGGPINPSPDDNTRAFSVMMNVRDAKTSEIPKEVDFHTLLQFLLLADKYGFNEALRVQANIWIKLLRHTIPHSLTDQLLPWLWISWIFDMSPEFKALTAIAQKEARNRIDSDNPYGVPIPQRITDAIQNRRLEAISQVKSLLVSQISERQESYSRTFSQGEDQPWHPLDPELDILMDSLVLGYLHLEGSRWGVITEGDGEIVQYNGVRFSDICHHIRNMIDLGDWCIRTVPPADRMPGPISMFAALVPILGVGLHSAGVGVFGSSSLKEKFIDLVKRLEQDEWGLDLELCRG